MSNTQSVQSADANTASNGTVGAAANATGNEQATTASQKTIGGAMSGSRQNGSGSAVSNAISGTLASTGVVLPAMLSITLALFIAAYLLKIASQYKRETH
ncbi:hypothetical protein [Bifidobacterium breve]|uniref:hypothetical protein n=1 Tax=Bifidobacterium breve TaxID=1685 RepID=UPI0032DF06CD